MTTEDDSLFSFTPGSTALLIDVPHAGIGLSPGMTERLTPAGIALTDTDWHVEKLYAFAAARGAALMVARHSRYVVDLNRDPAGRALYPGADNTEICPTRRFDNKDLYRPGELPAPDEVGRRVAKYWQPYHDRLAAELAAIRARHGFAILLDGHSIAAEVPRFFEGRLPDLNFGTNDGKSCAPDLDALAYGILAGSGRFSHVRNGRFRGGYITREYGRPDEGLHAMQLEIARDSYMHEDDLTRWDAAKAAPLIDLLRRLVDGLLGWRPA